LPKDRIRNISRVGEYSGRFGRQAPNKAQSLLPPPSAVASRDRDDFFDLIGEWRKRLRTHLPRYKPTYALLRDAMVMATLEWTNERAAGGRRRLILITGSPYLFAAGESVKIEGETFAKRYLRHPLAFVASEDFFSVRDGRAEFRLLEWLNLFFPDALKRLSSRQ
jgi:hypothetical protein